MSVTNFNIQGLTQEEVNLAREKFGQNTLQYKKDNRFIDGLKSLAKEPMVILLLVASSIYFMVGKTGDGIFLAIAMYWYPRSLYIKIQEARMHWRN